MSVDLVAAALGRGSVVIVPTDTVYGVAARLEDARELFVAKGRADDKPIPVLGADVTQLTALARFDDASQRLVATFWPGPLTLVLPRAEGFDAYLGEGGESTVAVRVPAHPLALELLRRTGPLAVTSANRSGEPPCPTVADARTALGGDLPALDAGPLRGSPSTVASVVPELTVLREGALGLEELRSALGDYESG